MPKLMGKEATLNQETNSGFGFTGTPVNKLGASEYTVVNLLVDLSGSVQGWERQLEDCVKTISLACRKSPRAENLLFRVVGFNTSVWEVHGFIELMKVNPNDYNGKFQPGGYTALLDAFLNGVEATGDYAAELNKKDIFCNAVLFCITDGAENSSTIATIGAPSTAKCIEHGQKKIAKVIKAIRDKEELESFKTILIGVADPQTTDGQELEKLLQEFKKNSNIDEFVMIGNMSKGTLAKLAGFVSQSVSSSSQALNTGGPSQPINPASVKPVDLNSI